MSRARQKKSENVKASGKAGSGQQKAKPGSGLSLPEVPARSRQMVRAILSWFAENRRDLPWRKDYRPYAVWVSEIMLQQTQMDRGVGYFNRWMALFPDIESLASAPVDRVLKAWEGLGYYSRARNLHKAAFEILERFEGRVPDTKEALVSLPGVGEYTAGAILSIAFNKPAAAVDANVERVFSRVFDLGQPVKSPGSADFIRFMVNALIPEGRAREFSESLMELGALVCGKNPLCGECPIAGWCEALKRGTVKERPVAGKKTGYTLLEVVAGVIVSGEKVYIQKRPESGLWAGFWEFPGGHLEAGESPAQAVLREIMEETDLSARVVKQLGTVRHSYTRYRIELHCFICQLEGAPCPEPVLHAATEYRWVRPEDLDAFTFAAGHRKLLERWHEEIQKNARDALSEIPKKRPG